MLHHSKQAWLEPNRFVFDDVDSGPIAFGVAVGTANYWICSIAVTQLTPIMLSSPLQVFGTMYCFAGAAFISFIFILLTLPETKVYYTVL